MNALEREAVGPSYASFLAGTARAAAYDEETIATALRCLPLCGDPPRFSVTAERITLVTTSGVEVWLRRRGRTCFFYAPSVGSDRCSFYRGRGRCARPDMDVCPEWLRVNPHRAARAAT